MSCSDNTAQLAAPRRSHFFFGKMMGVEQFELEQRYGIGLRRLMNRLSLGTGILCGLEVAIGPDGKRLRVGPGVAVDPLGREIVVPGPADFDPLAPAGACACEGEGPPTAPGRYQLCLEYRECAADAQPVPFPAECAGGSEAEFGATVETFALRLCPAPEQPPTSFACDAWIRPLPGEGALPPGAAELRARLAELLKSRCTPATAGRCVVLGTVVLAGAPGGGLTVQGVLPEGRVFLYSQAQLLDLVLCMAQTVARCCGGDVVVEPPPPGETLRLTAIDFVRVTTVASHAGVDVIAPLGALDAVPSFSIGAVTGPPTYSTGNAGVAPPSVRFTFNRPLDGTSVSWLLGGTGVTVTDQAGAPAVVQSLLLDANVLLVMLSGLGPGVYRMALRGTEAAGLPPIRSWDPDPTRRRPLDGEPGSPAAPLPSGDGTDGGDFAFSFELVP
jgi:hypothetical protein